MGINSYTIQPRNTTIPEFVPPSYALTDPPRVRVFRGFGVNPQAFSSAVSGGGSNSPSIYEQLVRSVQASSRVQADVIGQHRRTAGTIFINEISCGLPWGVAFGNGELMGATVNKAVASNVTGGRTLLPWGDAWRYGNSEQTYAAHHNWQKAQGWKRLGLGNILRYPGGFDAYAEMFIVPMLEWEVEYQVLGTFSRNMTGTWYRGTGAGSNGTGYAGAGTTPTGPTGTLTAPQRAAIKAAGPFMFLLNLEMFFPLFDPIFLTPNWTNSDTGVLQSYDKTIRNVNYQAGEHLIGMKIAMIEQRMFARDGSYPSDAAIVAELATPTSMSPTNAELRDAFVDLVTKTVQKVSDTVRALCPGSEIMAYEWPASVPYYTWTPVRAEHTAALADETNPIWNKMWACFDYTGCGIGYTPFQVVADNATPVTNEIKYSEEMWYRSGVIERNWRLKEHLRSQGLKTRVGITVRPTYNGRLTGAKTSKCMAHVAYLTEAEAVYMWESPGYTADSRVWTGSAWPTTNTVSYEGTNPPNVWHDGAWQNATGNGITFTFVPGSGNVLDRWDVTFPTHTLEEEFAVCCESASQFMSWFTGAVRNPLLHS